MNTISTKLPIATEIHYLKGIPTIFTEVLNYCAFEALQIGGGLAYDSAADQVIYHLKIDDDDRELFPWLRPMDEIWVIQTGMGQEAS